MVKILNPTPHKSVVKETVCRTCGATLEYTPNDVTSEVHHDYGGGSDTYYFIRCPNCDRKTGVPQ